MHPREFWWIAESKQDQRRYGKLSGAEAEEIYREAYGDVD